MCRGEIIRCIHTNTALTEEQCVAALDEPQIVAIHYNPANSQCPRYTCEDIVYFDDQVGSTRWFGRHTNITGQVHWTVYSCVQRISIRSIALQRILMCMVSNAE